MEPFRFVRAADDVAFHKQLASNPQTAKIKAYASAGITTTQSALFDAELAAAQRFSRAT